jgi:hypothetical protein
MKSLKFPTLSSVLFAFSGIALGQPPSPSLDSYLGAAKVAAGTDWAGTFLRLCIPPPDYGATALLSNHTEFDNAVLKAHAADDRKDGEANPFDVGAESVARYFAVVDACATAARIRATGK